MFSLFELAKVVEFSKDNDHDVGKQYKNIINHAWKDVGKRTALAINFSNGYLVLWHAIPYQKPVMRKVPWFPNRPILSMCYDFTATWLLCCVHQAVIILPALSLLEPSAVVNKIWPTDNSTEIHLSKMKGKVTSSCWWHTYQEDSIAILSTDAGMLYLVNLLTEQVKEMQVSEHVSHVQLVRNHSQGTTTLLITSKSNRQWKLPLERRSEAPRIMLESEIIWKSPVGAQSKRFFNYKSILHRNDDLLSEEIRPKPMPQFSLAVEVSVQHAKGRHLVTKYNIKTHEYQVYESDMEHSPLYVYHLPDSTDNVLLTDKLMFLTSVDKCHVLSVAANQLAEADNDEGRSQTVIQKFVLPPDEEILAIYKHSFPTNWHKLSNTSPTKDAEFLLGELSKHSVLDGCLVLSSKTVYVCRPSVSPELLFMRLVQEENDFTLAERLAYILGLDLNLLYKLGAERSLATKKDCPLALKILDRSTCPTNFDKVELLLNYGFVKESMPILSLMVAPKGINELPPEKRPLLTRIATTCYVHQIVTSDENKDKYKAEFRNFLFTNYYLDKKYVLQILFQFGLSTLFVDFAQERDIFVDAIKVLIDNKDACVELPAADQILWKKYPYITIPFSLDPAIKEKITLENLLQLLDVHEFLLILDDDPGYGTKLAALLLLNLPKLREKQLLQLVAIFDISKPPWKRWCHLAMKSSGHESSDEESNEGDNEAKVKSDVIHSVVHLFLSLIIYLNHRRVPRTASISLKDCTNIGQIEKKNIVASSSATSAPKEELASRPNVLSCGENSTALVRNGDLYTWGCTKDGRLGQGNLQLEMDCTPHVIKSFHEYGIPIMSVSCGTAHGLALSGKGVYGWGSSQYGQVGTGISGTSYSSPVYVDKLDGINITSVVCGQYHSLAVTADFKLYTWGWGIHGQLGHGDVENYSVPTRVSALDNKKVVMASAGYAHTVALTLEGVVYTFGCNSFGQLGNGGTVKSSHPVEVTRLKETIVKVSTNYFHSLALADSGKLYCWGASPLRLRQEMIIAKKASNQQKNNSSSQNKHLVPSSVDTRDVRGKITKLCCGATFSAVLAENGEVFTWGANNDGQLGTGTKIAESKLCRLSCLREVRMVSIATGANFMVAMDTTGDLHSWGNNDKGQLGIRPHHPGQVNSQTGKAPTTALGRTYLKMLMETNSILQPTRIDTSTLSRVRNLQKFKEELARAGYNDNWWLECSGTRHVGSADDNSLPALEGLGSIPYPPQSLLVTLHYLPQWAESDWMLGQCAELADWGTATILAVYLKKYNLAFHYHMKHPKMLNPEPNSDFEREFLAVVYQHVSLHEPKNVSSSPETPVSMDQLCLLVWQILKIWTTEKFKIASLQDIVLDFRELLSLPFLLNLMRKRDWTSMLEEELQCALVNLDDTNVPIAITQGFTPDFMPVVVQNATNFIQNNAVKSTILEHHIADIFPESDKVKTSRKLIDKDKLWQDIKQHMSKDRTGQSVIHISKQELAQLSGAPKSSLSACPLTSDSMSSREQSPPSLTPMEVVFFTCGHHCKRSFLRDTLVPELVLKLTERTPPLTRSAQTLAEQYRASQIINLACPKCVYDYIAKL